MSKQILGIKSIQTHFYCRENLELQSATRKHDLIRCVAHHREAPLKYLFLEFHHESIAVRFHEDMKAKCAIIFMRKDGDDSIYQTAGIKRFVVMYDDRICAYGFDGEETPLREWMDTLGFPIGNRIVESH